MHSRMFPLLVRLLGVVWLSRAIVFTFYQNLKGTEFNELWSSWLDILSTSPVSHLSPGGLANVANPRVSMFAYIGERVASVKLPLKRVHLSIKRQEPTWIVSLVLAENVWAVESGECLGCTEMDVCTLWGQPSSHRVMNRSEIAVSLYIASFGHPTRAFVLPACSWCTIVLPHFMSGEGQKFRITVRPIEL